MVCRGWCTYSRSEYAQPRGTEDIIKVGKKRRNMQGFILAVGAVVFMFVVVVAEVVYGTIYLQRICPWPGCSKAAKVVNRKDGWMRK